MSQNSKEVAKIGVPGVVEVQQNEEDEGPPRDLLFSIMQSILSTGDLMAMTKLLSQKLKKNGNKALILSGIGRIEKMLMNTVNIVGSFDGVGRTPVSKLLSNTKAVQVLLNKMKAILNKVDAENISDILNDIIKESDAIIQCQSYQEIVDHVRNLSSAASRLSKAVRQEGDLEEDQIYKVKL